MLALPNIVSTDEERREVWIYDKIATDTAYSSSSGADQHVILGGRGSVAGSRGREHEPVGPRILSLPADATGVTTSRRRQEGARLAYHTSRF